MAPLKPYFTGQEVPPKRRVATCQKCVRTGDIENDGNNGKGPVWWYPMEKMYSDESRPDEVRLEEMKRCLLEQLEQLTATI